MSTSVAEIKAWFDAAPEGTSHMIVATDTFSYEDYPIYVPEGENPKDHRPTGEMVKVMECYRLSLGWEAQSKEYRANHWEWKPPEWTDPEPWLSESGQRAAQPYPETPESGLAWENKPRTREQYDADQEPVEAEERPLDPDWEKLVEIIGQNVLGGSAFAASVRGSLASAIQAAGFKRRFGHIGRYERTTPDLTLASEDYWKGVRDTETAIMQMLGIEIEPEKTPGIFIAARTPEENVDLVRRTLAVQCPLCKRMPGSFCDAWETSGLHLHPARISAGRTAP